MAENSRWHVIPKTKPLCYLGLFAGILLFASSMWTLSTDSARIPIFSIIAAVCALALAAFSIIGLASPRLRGR
jgi:hypothetical protein